VGLSMKTIACASEYAHLGRLWRREMADLFANEPHFFAIPAGLTLIVALLLWS